MALKANKAKKEGNLHSTQVGIHHKKYVYASFFRRTHLDFKHFSSKQTKTRTLAT